MKFGCSIGIFLNSAHLICRSTDISKCFRGSLRLRDNESRLYNVQIHHQVSYPVQWQCLVRQYIISLMNGYIPSFPPFLQRKKKVLWFLALLPWTMNFQILTLKAPNKNCSRRHFFFLLLFFEKKKKAWCCMWILCLGISKCRLLQMWL